MLDLFGLGNNLFVSMGIWSRKKEKLTGNVYLAQLLCLFLEMVKNETVGKGSENKANQ